MSRVTHVRAAGMASLFVLAAAILVVCRSGDAGPAAQAQSPGEALPADSLALALLATVRGSDPVLCELAIRAVDGRHGWSSTPDELAGVGAQLSIRQQATIRWAVDGENEEQAHTSAAVTPLAAALADPDACVRRMAALKLGRMRDPRGLDALREALVAPDAGRRAIGALGLGYSEDPAALDALGGALDDPSPEVRSAAAWALGEIEDARAIPLLIPVLGDDEDPVVRQVAAWALGEIE